MFQTAEEAEPRPQPLRLRHRPENMRRANVTSQAKEEKPARPATAPGDTCFIFFCSDIPVFGHSR